MHRQYYDENKDHAPISLNLSGQFSQSKYPLTIKRKKREMRPRHVLFIVAVFCFVWGVIDSHLMQVCIAEGHTAEYCITALR